MKLENVRFVQSSLTRKRIAALFLLSVGVPYAWKRFFRYISSSRWDSVPSSDDTHSSAASEAGEARRTRLLKVMKWLETFVISCQFANLLAFLRKGTYRSLPERCLGMKMVRAAEKEVDLLCCVKAAKQTHRLTGCLVLVCMQSIGEHCSVNNSSFDQL